MRATPARRLAAEVVERVVRDQAWASGVLDAALRKSNLDRREAAFATRLAYGAIELLPVLDDAIRSRASRPGRIKPRVMAALRVAAYDVLMLDTPHAIAVDQGVALVKEHDTYAASFANAVLRKLAAEADEFPWGDPETDIEALGRLSGFSVELVQRLIGELGERAAMDFIKGSMGPPPFYVAANPHKTTVPALAAALEAAGSPVTEYLPQGCLRCHEPAAALSSDLLEAGSALAADRSAQIVASLVPLDAGPRVLEIASGRGNKTALMDFAAVRAGVPRRIAAVDSHDWKTGVLEQRMALLGVTDYSTRVLDATDASGLEGGVGADFDAALVDAPCSNLGTLRRHPEQRWRYTDDMPQRLATLGNALLQATARLVRPGGFVVYSTCTVLPSENARVIEAFLAHGVGREFRVVTLNDRVPPDVVQNVTPEGYYQSVPGPDGPDGHFAALLQRDEGPDRGGAHA